MTFYIREVTAEIIVLLNKTDQYLVNIRIIVAGYGVRRAGISADGDLLQEAASNMKSACSACSTEGVLNPARTWR